ncbi:MAG: dephospho-CoA kinase [Gammaproteobacteria bacterium]|nr:dephospho-CoA kinase [Gammaproteobacteria bacterium]
MVQLSPVRRFLSFAAIFFEQLVTVIGLTGGIASGKSTISAYAKQHGAHVIDADVLGHQAYEPGTDCFDAVVAEFGEDVLAADGAIDRRALGAKVFAEGSSLERLTDIVWPAIKRMAQDEIDRIKRANTRQIVVLEAAVLLEAGWQDFVDEVWVVTVDPEVAIARTMARDGLDREAVQSRIDAQITNTERITKADVVIDNSSTEQALNDTVAEAFDQLSARSAA